MPPKTSHSAAAAELWHPSKNLPLSLDDFSPKNTTIVWWKCAQGHEWQTGVRRINEGQRCPYCEGRLPIVGKTDLATTHPELVQQWSPRNTASPSEFFATSGAKVWWICEQGHEWETRIETRSRGAGCSVCSGKLLVPGVNDLATTHPDLASQWHPSKNGDLSPQDVTATRTQSVWWQCENGHEWEVSVNRRARGEGCAYCSGRKVVPSETDFATKHPELLAEWDYEKNTVDPITISPGYRKKVWWKGSQCGHSWDAQVASRTRGEGCPICAGKRVLVGFNDLATTNPELVSQWHPTKNGDLTAQQVVAGSSMKVWWQCEQGHTWESSVAARTKSKGSCPVCAGRTVLPGYNDLATTHPDLVKQWHPSKNGDLSPQSVIAGSHSKVWWECDLGHSWEATVYSRISGSGCPVCAGKITLAGFNDLATTHPLLASQWHPTKNGTLTSQQVTAGSGTKVWWQCDVDSSHAWEATVYSRVAGNGCAVCAGKAVIAGVNDLATTHPDLAAQWHVTKNGDLTAREISAGSNQTVWWTGKCGHEWEATPNTRSRNISGDGCPVCANKVVVAGFNDLATTHPALAAQWHPTKNGELAPTQVSYASNKRAWWICGEGHEWETFVYGRAGGEVDCPTCANREVLSGHNDLATTHPLLAAEWHPTKNANLTPSQVTRGSAQMVWWQCAANPEHEWAAAVYSRTGGNGCPKCWNGVSKGETQVHDYIASILPVGTEIKTSVRSVIAPYELDIFIPSKSIAVEFNGLYWHSESFGKDKFYHRNKWELAHAAGIQLITVWEDDWRDRQAVVKSMLAHKLGVSTSVRIPARKTEAVEISYSQAAAFLDAHHIQGSVAGSYYVALRTKSTASTVSTGTPELVAVMVLKRSGEDLVLERYATAAHVIGGQSKLVKFVERSFTYRNLITFADLEVSDGGLYETTGFTRDAVLPPDYKYLYAGARQHKFGFRIERFRRDPLLRFEDGLSERQLAELNNIPRIWDCGKIRFVKPRPTHEN